MKRSDSIRRMVTVCIVFFMVLFVSQIEISSMSRQSAAMNSTRANPATSEFTLSSPITCNRSHRRYDICSISSPSTLNPKEASFYVLGRADILEKLRPYPRKSENFTMARIREVTLTSAPSIPTCTVQHNAPALVFSAAGYTGNFFHDFNDGFIPLFITVSSVYPDTDPVLVISNSRDWWVGKYADLLKSFSKHRIINLDNDTATHCFPSATVGLMSHGFMTIDSKLIPKSINLRHFHALLEKTYGGSRNLIPSSISVSMKSRPRLVLLSRAGAVGRTIRNQQLIKKAAEEEGFDVVEFKANVRTPLRGAYELMSSSHAMVGVHGAALTHLLFLRPGSVLMQLVPIGLGWVSEACFGKPARELGLEYLEYRIGVEESSLAEKYGNDSVVVKDPSALQKKGWPGEVMNMYLKEQDVKLDVVRFRGYLKKAYEKANVFMENNG